jgi:uncharacterized hydrophobic protein (TIGR00271 family)
MKLPAITSWLNPTSAKGLVFVLSGLFVLAAPQVALPSLRVLLALTLLVVALINLWGHGATRDSAHGRSRALLAGLAAIGLLTVPYETMGLVKWVVVAHLAATGVLALWRGLAQGRSESRRIDLGRGVMLLAAATVIFAIPHELLSIVVVVAAIAAVVIGAMLIAPLMTPIMGCAAGLVAGWRERVVGSFALVIVSVAAAIGLAWILASWVPDLVPMAVNTQILSRASPTLLDMAVALAAGAAGAYATTDERVSQSATGVAIAVALVPPLSVVGITLEAGRLDWALGAFLLFSTNLVSIIVASVVVFVLVGFSPIRNILEGSKAIADLVTMVAVAAILIMVPLGLSGRGLLEASQRSGAVQTHVVEWLEDSSLRLDRVKARAGEATILLSGDGEVPDISALEQALHISLGERVTVTVEHIPSRILTSDTQERNANYDH